MRQLHFIIAALVSLVLSAFIYFRLDVVNSDAVCYILSAEMSGRSGLHAAMQLCGQASWPFYSVLLFYVSKIIHLPIEPTAFLINSIFSMMSVVTFLAIIRALGGNQRVLWLALLTILLSHDFDSVRQYIIRDHGFWAFYLISFYFFLRYFQTARMRFALGWNGSLLVASLFRVEGVIFLVFLPFFVFFVKDKSLCGRVKSYLQLNIVNIPAALLLLIICLLGFHSFLQFGRAQEIILHLVNGVSMLAASFAAQKSAMAHYVLSAEGARDAGVLLTIMYPAWYVMNVVQSVSIVYALLILYGFLKKTLHTPLAMIAYLSVNVVITFAFLLERQFLSKRYLLALSLILMLYVPFVLAKIYEKNKRILFYAALTAMIASSLGGIFNLGHSKSYMREAGEWLRLNVSEKNSVYSNDVVVLYYASLPLLFKHVQLENAAARDYVALLTTKKRTEAHQFAEKVNQFCNKEQDCVTIYRK